MEAAYGIFESKSADKNSFIVERVTGVPESGMPALGKLIAQEAAQWDGHKPQGARIVLSKGGVPVSRIVLENRG